MAFQTARIGMWAAILSMAAAHVQAAPIQVIVRIENLAPPNGTFLTPPWVGFHDGTFDLYDRDVSASLFPGLEALAEDGNTGPVSSRFASEQPGGVQGTLPGPIAPAGTMGFNSAASMQFLLDSTAHQFFSYASMIIPSNDAFIANGNPLAHPLFDSAGRFIGANFIVAGSQVLDAGTEVNDELPMNTAFFGQMTGNTGVNENGVVVLHGGFNPVGSGGILDDPRFANGDFLADGYEVARVSVTVIPEPGTVVLLAAGLVVIGLGRRVVGRW